MCGIAGYLGEGNQDILEKMTDSLYHRGPDDKGFLFEGKLGLGHRRLSIIDLSQSGRQPMSNEDGSIQIVLNGEIYNYKELRKKLKQQHKFKSQTDTEIIIHLYEEIGTEV
ncbi:asparagine synthetase B, partial [bacterium]|nr:asparagine synthetase B [bacterium]